MTKTSKTMKAVVTRGSGGFEKLVYCEVPVPTPKADEVLVKVLAAGINNTDINTRIGWYSSKITGSTNDLAETQIDNGIEDGGWNKATPFPFIQGADCCGHVITHGSDPTSSLIGKRVLVRSCMRIKGFEHTDAIWLGIDFNGAFAQYVTVPATEVFPIQSDWQDTELASIPCAYGTAENMLHKAAVSEKDSVLITGASGGVGAATVQLAKRRGAKVLATTSGSKKEAIRKLGADQVFDRDDNLLSMIGKESVDVVIDCVAGTGFPVMVDLLKRGGRYVTAGAIGGALVSFDIRQLYLKDLTMIGSTNWEEPIFPNLISYIENNEITPAVSKTFPLEQIEAAQKLFLEKKHVGKIVLVPPQS